MNTPFKYVGNIDVSEILEVFKNDITEDNWLEDTSRSEIFEVHKDTHMLKVLWDIDFTKKMGEKHDQNYNLFNFDKISKTLTDVYELHYKKGQIIRALFTRLNPHGEIPPHVDGGDSLGKCHRTHIPIITNEKNVFQISTEIKNLKAGEIWEICNTMVHTTKNMSDESRIHLIVDYMEDAPIH